MPRGGIRIEEIPRDQTRGEGSVNCQTSTSGVIILDFRPSMAAVNPTLDLYFHKSRPREQTLYSLGRVPFRGEGLKKPFQYFLYIARDCAKESKNLSI